MVCGYSQYFKKYLNASSFTPNTKIGRKEVNRGTGLNAFQSVPDVNELC